MLAYAEKRQRVQGAVQASLDKDTSNLFRHREKQPCEVSLRDFNQVIDIDTYHQTADVEGLTTYEDLVAASLQHGLMPAVVPELKTITIGGALAGIGIESSSFRYGLVHETILAFEVLLPDGQVLDCRPDNAHSDLYFAFPNSYGTLGYVLKVTVKLVPVKPYVKLTHQYFSRAEDYFAALQNCRDEIDFVEGCVFKEDQMVVTIGEFVNEAPYTSDYTFMQIYYQSLMRREEDYLTVADYIWRWDTDWFWCSRVFGVQNKLLRRLCGKQRLNSRSYWRWMHKAHVTPWLRRLLTTFSGNKESVIQDVAIPIDAALEFFHYFNQHIGIKPFWNCPVRAYQASHRFDLFPLSTKQLYINFGFWDTVPSDKPDGFLNKKIEQKVRELYGLKSLYSNSFYSEEEFWQIFDKQRYQSLKLRYDRHNLKPNLYQKCVIERS